MVTIRDIAAATGFSPGTVSAVLGNNPRCYASKANQELIRKTAKKMGYVPNIMAKALRTGRTQTIGFLGNQFANNVAWMEFVHIHTILQQHKYSMLTQYFMNEVERLQSNCRELIKRGCDGLIICSVNNARFLEILEPFADRTVILASQFSGIELPENSILTDYRSGLEEMVCSLHSLGHRNCIQICTNGISPTGLRRTVFKEGFPDCPVINVNSEQIGEECIRKMLQQYPETTAIVCSNDIIAIRVVGILQRLGIRIPEDISITGFDDLSLCDMVYPALSTVHQPIQEKLENGVNLLLNMLDSKDLPVNRICKTSFVQRESTAPARQYPLKLQ